MNARKITTAARLVVCVRTHKLCFPSRKRALTGMNHARAAHAHGERSGSAPVAVYRCPFCSEWHLTSQPQRSAAA